MGTRFNRELMGLRKIPDSSILTKKGREDYKQQIDEIRQIAREKRTERMKAERARLTEAKKQREAEIRALMKPFQSKGKIKPELQEIADFLEVQKRIQEIRGEPL